MRLTDGQVRQTVAAMRMDAELKDRLAAQAIAGDMGARLVVYGAMRRQRAAETRVEFDPSPYVASHGKGPRGVGSWAFHAERSPDSLDPGMIWVHGATYSDAKAKAAKVARERGWSVLRVQP